MPRFAALKIDITKDDYNDSDCTYDTFPKQIPAGYMNLTSFSFPASSSCGSPASMNSIAFTALLRFRGGNFPCHDGRGLACEFNAFLFLRNHQRNNPVARRALLKAEFPRDL
jgi:hypothetical protein